MAKLPIDPAKQHFDEEAMCYRAALEQFERL